MSRFTLCCELAGDRRSGERDAGAYQARRQDADAGEPERDAGARSEMVRGREGEHLDGGRQITRPPGGSSATPCRGDSPGDERATGTAPGRECMDTVSHR